MSTTSKYGNKKVVIDGITFDSKAEARYYTYALERQERGEITNLVIQPTFTLAERFKRADGSVLQRVTYIADFQFEEQGKTVVVDVKGLPTAVFMLKARLFKQYFEHIELRVVNYTVKYGWETMEEQKKRRREQKK